MPRRRRILVVEDDRAVRDLLIFTLADEGYEVRQASTGQDALEILDTWQPDLILLDFMLSDMDGRSFMEQLAHSQTPASTAPVLLVTGTNDPEGLATEIGAAGVVQKPFDLDELITKVAGVNA